MRRVVLESPYGGVNREHNVAYAEAALRDSLNRGESPFASHLLYTRVLEDDIPKERRIGMAAGFAWGEVAELCAVYQDLGISDGMRAGIQRAEEYGITIEYRTLPDWRRQDETKKGVVGPRWTGEEVDPPAPPAPSAPLHDEGE